MKINVVIINYDRLKKHCKGHITNLADFLELHPTTIRRKLNQRSKLSPIELSSIIEYLEDHCNQNVADIFL